MMTLACAVAPARADSAAGIQWTAPAAWKSLGARPMRAVTYVVPPAAGDSEAGECAVFYFGPGQGGGVEENIKRWAGQFSPLDKAPQTRKQTISGLAVTTIDLAGTYLAAAGPMAQAKTVKPGYRLLGGIVEAPEGSVFFKFTGPVKTVAAQESAFHGMLKTLRK